MAWFAFRAVYLHERHEQGNVYGERIVLHEAESAEAAAELAETESADYLRMNPRFERVGEWVVFVVQPRTGSLRGSEVWSGLLQSSLDPLAFYERRYREFEAPFEDDSEADD